MKKSSSKNSILSDSQFYWTGEVDVRAENFYFQVKFINCYLREIISFTKKIDIRDWGQSNAPDTHLFNMKYLLPCLCIQVPFLEMLFTEMSTRIF